MTSPIFCIVCTETSCMQGETSFWRVLWDMLVDVKAVAQGEESRAFAIALCLAFFNQAMASSAIINYAPKLLRDSGIDSEIYATLLSATVTAAKVTLSCKLHGHLQAL